jgi:hypothetical protein
MCGSLVDITGAQAVAQSHFAVCLRKKMDAVRRFAVD